MQSGVVRLFSEQSRDKGKKERTRSLLLDSAASLVSARGYESVTIAEVASHAGLANGTFYNHFADKETLLREVALGIAAAVAHQINQDMSDEDDAVTRVVRATSSFIDIARREPEWARVLVGSAGVVPEVELGLARYLSSDVQRGITQGVFDVQLDKVLVNQFIALVRTAVLLVEEEQEYVTRRTCEAVLRLLGVEEG